METKLRFQIDTFSILARSIIAVLSVMENLKRPKFPFSKHLDCRQWRSETDIQRSSLPPIQNNEKRNSKPITTSSAGKQLCPNRPPTPNPARQQETLYSWGRTSRMSPSNSSQRLSLSLDLRPVIEGAANSRRYSTGFVDNSPEAEWSPRPCIRSLPPSPTVQRSQRLHRSLRRLSSDSEHIDEKFKDDRIMNWIRDVSEKTHSQNSHDDDEYDVFECSLENDDDISVPGLPVIQEGHKI